MVYSAVSWTLTQGLLRSIQTVETRKAHPRASNQVLFASFANRDKYVGEYKDGKIHGQGTTTLGDKK
ncbi:MAG: hypothetical protein HOJ38_07765, partial [Rhodobiaceae bacterium]|nr:hypothetical protein [Rhodobiaceae bacterium]